MAEAAVTMCEHSTTDSRWPGLQRLFDVGEYRRPDADRLRSDFFSSAVIPPGFKLVIYEHEDFEGVEREFPNDTDEDMRVDFGDMSDRTSSLKVEALFT